MESLIVAVVRARMRGGVKMERSLMAEVGGFIASRDGAGCYEERFSVFTM